MAAYGTVHIHTSGGLNDHARFVDTRSDPETDSGQDTDKELDDIKKREKVTRKRLHKKYEDSGHGFVKTKTKIAEDTTKTRVSTRNVTVRSKKEVDNKENEKFNLTQEEVIAVKKAMGGDGTPYSHLVDNLRNLLDFETSLKANDHEDDHHFFDAISDSHLLRDSDIEKYPDARWNKKKLSSNPGTATRRLNQQLATSPPLYTKTRKHS